MEFGRNMSKNNKGDLLKKRNKLIHKILITVICAVIGSSVQFLYTYTLANLANVEWSIAFFLVLPVGISIILILYIGFVLRNMLRNIAEKKLLPPYHESIKNPPNQTLQEVLELAGIIDATTSLSESKFTPSECMKKATKRLWFMGILGSKWVIPAHVRFEFEQFLKKMEAVGGSVRFLLINPESQAFAKLRSFRGGAISCESLKYFAELIAKYGNTLEVRLYDHLPHFRLVFIDDSLLAMSRYKIDMEGYFQSKFGWDAPHLVISRKSDWSLAYAFEMYYVDEWLRAKNLQQVKL